MTQKEVKEYTKLVPRFKEICCQQMCNSWEYCKDNETSAFMACPWFFGYRMDGWPIKRLSDFSYNAEKLPDLRTEDLDPEFFKRWKNKK